MSPGQLDEEVDGCCWAPTSNKYIFLLTYIHKKAHENNYHKTIKVHSFFSLNHSRANF